MLLFSFISVFLISTSKVPVWWINHIWHTIHCTHVETKLSDSYTKCTHQVPLAAPYQTATVLIYANSIQVLNKTTKFWQGYLFLNCKLDWCKPLKALDSWHHSKRYDFLRWVGLAEIMGNLFNLYVHIQRNNVSKISNCMNRL